MKASFVIPVYNVMPYLERCVKSVLCQTYKDFEVILVDDGSPDDCGKLCDELAKGDSRIVVIHQENKGLSGARNTGIDNARGEYVIFIDSDDYWLLDDGLQTLIDNSDPQTDMVAFKEVNIWKDDRRTKATPYNLETVAKIPNAQKLFAYLVKTQQMHFTSWLVMVRRQLLLDHHVYFPSRLIGEDFYWHFELWQHLHTVKLINLYLYAYCHREGSMTTRKNLFVPYLHYEKSFSYWKERCSQGCNNSEGILAYLANVWANRGYVYSSLNAEDKPKALDFLQRHSDLLDHALTPRVRFVAKMVRLFGIRFTAFFLGIYYYMRNRTKVYAK